VESYGAGRALTSSIRLEDRSKLSQHLPRERLRALYANSPNTPAFILGALNLDVPSNESPADGSATFTSLRLNGVELLVP
jgi:hypothetical protein